MQDNNFFMTQIDVDEYIDSGFLALQRSIDKAFIELSTDQHRHEFQVNTQFIVFKRLFLFD